MFTVRDGYILTYRDRNQRTYIGTYTIYFPSLLTLAWWIVTNVRRYSPVRVRRRVLELMTDSEGRPVCDVEFSNNGDGTAFIERASYWYELDGGDVPEDELEYLTDAYPEACDEYAFESAVDAAERYYEGDR